MLQLLRRAKRGLTPAPSDPEVDFIFIAALPKSASSLVWLIASALQEPSGQANPFRLKGEEPNPFPPLRDNIFKTFPTGGVWKSHSPLTLETEEVLYRTGTKHIVVLRHPADYVPALYCHCLRVAGNDQFGRGWREEREWLFFQIYPVRKAAFEAQTPMHDALGELIEGGALLHAMGWMADWLGFRDRSMSLVLRYEDLMQDFDGSVARISEFLFGRAPLAATMQYLHKVSAGDRERGPQKPSERYPRGWTGVPGVWREYFNDANVAAFERISDLFVRVHPHGKLLQEIYPDVTKLRR